MRAAVSLVLTLACLAAGAAEPAPAVATFASSPASASGPGRCTAAWATA